MRIRIFPPNIDEEAIETAGSNSRSRLVKASAVTDQVQLLSA